jgi:hypothetical protein
MEALLEKEGDVESWNDERLDELGRRMDKGFEEAAAKVELTALKNEMNLRFDRVDEHLDLRFDRVDEHLDLRFDRVDERFDLRFDRVDERFDQFAGRFGEVGKRFDKIDAQFMHIHDRLDRLNHTVLVGAFGVVAAVIANGIWG